MGSCGQELVANLFYVKTYLQIRYNAWTQSSVKILSSTSYVDEFSNLKSTVILSANSLPELIKIQGRRRFLVIIVTKFHNNVSLYERESLIYLLSWFSSFLCFCRNKGTSQVTAMASAQVAEQEAAVAAAAVPDWVFDPNEPRYCLCNQVSLARCWN